MGAALCLALWVGAVLPWSASAQVRTLTAVAFAGKRYVGIKDIAAMYGLPLVSPTPKSYLIRGQSVSLLFKENERRAILNGTTVWLHAPLTKLRGKWCISDADAQYVVDPIVRPSAYLSARGTRTVILDPGHGGKDPGAISAGGLQEKVLALDIARRTRAHLAAAGLNVVLTRNDDRFLELADRPKLAAQKGGDIFVSIHLNSTGGRAVQGIETFATAAKDYPATADGLLTRKHPEVPNNRFNHSSTALANQLQKALIGITRAEDRGLKRARFVVIRQATMPAALVECGFLSNVAETQKLSTPSYRETLAQGIAQGILNYFALVQRAKKELGAPLLQTPVSTLLATPPVAPSATTNRLLPAAAGTLPASPTPMAARAWGPAPGTATMNPAVRSARPISAVPVTVPAARIPSTTPAPAATPAPPTVAPAAIRPPAAIAPPPSHLLNPGLSQRPTEP